MGTNLMGELVANLGTFIANESNKTYTKNIDAIVVLEDTIFTSIFINEIDVKGDYLGVPDIAIKAGAIITPLNDAQFTGVELTSGSIALVLG
jgi:hypothetical protein